MFDPTTYRVDQRNANRHWPLNHRWLRAEYLFHRGKQPSKVRDDALIRDARKFLRALRCYEEGKGIPTMDDFLAMRKVKGGCRLMPFHFPAILEAHSCYYGWSWLRRAEVEARLLAGQGDDSIAERCQVSVWAMPALHDLFYDVRPYLGDDALIARLALNWCPRWDNPDHGGALKLFGYSLGGRAVDALLHYVIAPPDVNDLASGAASEGPDKARWERLLARVMQTLNALWKNNAEDLWLPIVALLREEGSGLVAEGVEIPVPSPRRFAIDDPFEEELEEDLFLLDDL
jgi:hypothetical protein